jgi:uncharacterized protein (DUF362 family)
MKKFYSRRQFIINSVKAGAVISAGSVGVPLSKLYGNSENESKNIDLAVVSGDPSSTVKKAIDVLGGIKKFLSPGGVVLLKPNVSFPNPAAWGSTTNPEVVKAVALLTIEAGASRVIVVDHTMQDGNLCFNKTGFTETFKDIKKVKLLPLKQENHFTEVQVQDGKALKTVKIAKLIKRADLLINLPCAKSHIATDVSFGLKNLMGLIWDRAYFHTGTDLHMAIAELSTVIRPQLTLFDATRALVTGGPSGPGKVMEMNTIIGGIDPLAVDSYATTLTNWNNRAFNVSSVKHLSYSSKLGIGEIDLKKLIVKNVDV